MAQSFVANAATRLQPIEWSTGIGAGAAAAHMTLTSLLTTRAALANIAAIQTRIRKHAPLEWTIAGAKYPAPGEVLQPVADAILCPAGAQFDEGYGFCASGADAYGPFTKAMTDRCVANGGGPACTTAHNVVVAGVSVQIARWSKSFARAIRGTGDCPLGATREAQYLGHCVERTPTTTDVYGPFSRRLVDACFAGQGGTACYTHRWSAAFFRSLASN